MHHPSQSAQAIPSVAVLPDVADNDAIDAVTGGQREMFEVIVRRYNAQLFRVGMAYLRDHAQTEDAMQNTYLKAFTHLHRFKKNATFRTWLTRIMINECLMFLRTKRRFSMETINDDDRTTEPEAFVVPPEDPVHQEEIRTLLEKVIHSLPRIHRAIYVLREVQHFSTAETAECLGISESNVKVTLHRARARLKSALLKSAAGIELFDYSARYCDPMTRRIMRKVLELPHGIRD